MRLQPIQILMHYQDPILGSQYYLEEINIKVEFIKVTDKASEALRKINKAIENKALMINRTTSLSAEDLNRATNSLRTGLAEFMGDNNPIKHTKFEDNPFNENLIKRNGNNRT